MHCSSLFITKIIPYILKNCYLTSVLHYLSISKQVCIKVVTIEKGQRVIFHVLVLLAANYFTATLTIQSGILCVINAVVVSLVANGSYDLIVSAKKSTTKKIE